MPRPLRIHYPNAWYHVMNRGAGRKKIFNNNAHRFMFLDLLAECHKRYNIRIYTYCLMDNHYHIMLSTPDANLSRVMRHINGIYTQNYNRLMKTDGPLFRGRYKSQLIDDDCYQLIVSHYIHLNPVEAGIVSDPADYKWSSYCAYLGLEKAPYWLSIGTIIDQLAETNGLSYVKHYQDYVKGKRIEEINFFSGIKSMAPIIGSEAFKEKILSKTNTLTVESFSTDLRRVRTLPKIELIMKHVCSFYNISREFLIYSKPGTLNWPKLVCIYICRKEFGHTLRAISQSVGFLRYETVSSAVQKCNTRLVKYPDLFNQVNGIVKHIKKIMLQPT